jgi:hypothetical protein
MDDGVIVWKKHYSTFYSMALLMLWRGLNYFLVSVFYVYNMFDLHNIAIMKEY